MLTMDPTSPRLRRDTNHAIAPEEQRRMDPQLLKALQNKDITALNKALKTPAINVNIPHGAHANTALHIAAQKLFVQGVNALVEARADINACNSLGQTPLHMVLGIKIMKLDTADKIGKILLEAGAHIHKPSKSIVHQDHPLFEEVIYAPLIRAIEDDNIPLMQQLLAQGADPNHFIINTDGNSHRRKNNQIIVPSLLNIATSCKNADALCILLDAGADPAKSAFLKEPSFSRGGYQPSTSDPICVLALSEANPEMAQLLFTHVPHVLIKRTWNTRGLQILLALSRLFDNKDLRLLICTDCVRDEACAEQFKIAQKMCEQAQPYMKWIEHSTVLDAANLPTYYPLWQEQICYALKMRPRASQSSALDKK